MRSRVRSEARYLLLSPMRSPVSERLAPLGRMGFSGVTLVGIWLSTGVVISVIAGHARDWFDMTDEMRYERLAESIARTHSLVPRIHGVLVESWAQLYPAVIAPVFHHRFVPEDIHTAHLLNAWLMTSACIPAYLLARRVLRTTWGPFVVALLSVCIPWLIYTTMLMTEVASYPAFLWAAFLLHRSMSSPSRGNDALAVVALALAFTARTALITLVVILPVAIVAFEVRRRRGLRDVLRSHDALVVMYLLFAFGAGLLEAVGRFSRIYGVYGHYTGHADLLTTAFWGSLSEHYATFALGIGVLPFVLGSAWLLRVTLTREVDGERTAFAWFALILVVVIPLQVTSFDDVYNGSFVHDRFFVYLVPLLLIGVCAALEQRGVGVWPLFVPVIVLATGYGVGAIPAFTWSGSQAVNPDTPASAFYRPLADWFGGLGGARTFLILGSVGAGVICLCLSRLSARVAVLGYVVVALPVLTWYVFDRYFSDVGPSGRLVTASVHGQLDWLDAAVGANAQVTIVPYTVTDDWFASQRFWRDLEFWNRSVARDLKFPSAGEYEYTGFWFPKVVPRFDPRTGIANMTLTKYVVMSDAETRFRISGPATAEPSTLLIKSTKPWRLDWLTSGLYDDGWTEPGKPARITVYPARGQRGPQTRSLTLQLRAPQPTSVPGFTLTTNLGKVTGAIPANGTVNEHVTLCVPTDHPSDVTISTAVNAPIPGDLGSEATSSLPRQGGLLVGQIALADELGGTCRSRG